MLISLLLTTLCLPAAAIPTPVCAPAPIVQDDDEELPDKRPEVKELLVTLKDHAGARGKEDTEAVAVIDKLFQEFPQSGKKDRASIVAGLGKCFSQKRKELEGGIKDNKLFIAAAVALGEMGPESVKVLEKWIGDKRHRKDLALQQRLIRALGKTKNTKAVKTLLGLLDDKEDVLVGCTAEALGEYGEAPQKLRKEIFNELLKILMTNRALMKDPNNITARDRYDVVAAPIITTLQALSGHDERNPDHWQRWWNKNKKGDWDAED